MLKVVKNLQYLSNIANQQGFKTKWRPINEEEEETKFTPKQIQAAKKLEGKTLSKRKTTIIDKF